MSGREMSGISQTFFELRFSLENEGKDGKNLNSQTLPESPRRPSPRHPRPPDSRPMKCRPLSQRPTFAEYTISEDDLACIL